MWGAGVDSLLTAKGALRLKGGGPRKEVASAEKLSWQQHLIVGGVARGVSVGSLFPIDSIKTRMQVGQKISLGLSDLGQVHFAFDLLAWLLGIHCWQCVLLTACDVAAL